MQPYINRFALCRLAARAVRVIHTPGKSTLESSVKRAISMSEEHLALKGYKPGDDAKDAQGLSVIL